VARQPALGALRLRDNDGALAREQARIAFILRREEP
jgi:hypothetical protein